MQNCNIPAQILEAENDSGSTSSRRWGGIHRSIHKVLKQIPRIVVKLRLEKTFQHPLHKVDFPVSSSRNDHSMVQRNQTRHAVSITKGGLVGLSDGDIEIISWLFAPLKALSYLARRVQYPFTTFTQALKTGSAMLPSIAGSSTKF